MFPKVNQDLSGLEPVDWNEVKKVYPEVSKYKVGEILHRDEVMRSLCHRDIDKEEQDVPLEQVCRDLLDDEGPGAKELRSLAKHYIVLRNKNARLASFGKWINSLFKDRQEFIALLAKVGQKRAALAKKSSIVISCNPVDILRGGLGDHFMTCLGPKGGRGGWGGAYADVLPAVLAECPGVAVAFVEDRDKEAYLARCWIHHIEVNGKVAIQMNSIYGNGMGEQQLAALIASKGYDVYDQSWAGNTNYKFINNFKRNIHWDALESKACGTLVAKAQLPAQLKKKAA